MYKAIIPKLPMRNLTATKQYYSLQLGFEVTGEYVDYLIMQKGMVEIHFFAFKELDPRENYGQVYIRTTDIDQVYQELQDNLTQIHPNGHLQDKPWGQREFSLLDPDNNLLTFGQSIE